MEPIFSIPLIIIFLLALALISFFLSASETAIISLSKIKLRHMIAQGVKHAQSIYRLITKMDRFIAAILIGNNFVNIAMSAIITAVFVRIFGYNWGVIISTFVTAFFVLVFCEITPKILATKRTDRVALLVAPFMEKVVNLFDPIVHVFIALSNLILKLLKIGPGKRPPLITEEELRTMIEIGQEEGVLSSEEKKMLHRIFEFGDTKVEEVMVPKEEIVGVNINATSEELLNIFVEQGHARLPVYEGSVDKVVGVVYAQDLLYILRDKGLFLLQDLLHKPCRVSSWMLVSELLRKFQTDKVQIAIVVDERARTQGLVTLEDLLEEIVGEIEEEHSNHRTNKN
jgi:putative hemolysin